MTDKYYYHYTDDEGAQNIIRSNRIQASLSHMKTDDAGFGNGVYLTTLKAKTCTKSQIAMNNWLKTSAPFINKTKNYFVIKIPDKDIKDVSAATANERNIFVFGQRNDLRLRKYPWWLMNYDSDKIISSYKYQISTIGPANLVPRLSRRKGEYIMSDETVNGRPVYKHDSAEAYLFMTSVVNWMVGPDPGQDLGWFEQESEHSLGPDSQLPWKYYDGGQWNMDDVTLSAYAWQM